MSASGHGLNPPQQEAVSHVDGPLLVFAGAGSGKTRVITHRIAHLLSRVHVPPYRVLAVTFTNKAAGEMRERLRTMVGEDVARDVWVGTFHATCVKLLRTHAEAAGLSRSFVIYDSSDQKSVVTRAIRELDLDEKRYAPRAMLSRILKEKQEGRGPDTMELDSWLDEDVQRIYQRYEEKLAAANAVDFEDIILKALRVLEAGDGAPTEAILARDALRRKFAHVLVDEFQDTNATQYRLVRALSAATRNLCVVGDDDQSIYRWRGADVRNIRGFRTDYPDARVVKLEQNYRSTKNVVASALAVIQPSRTREPKELFTDNELGDPVRVVACADERDEAASVLKIVRDAREAGVPPEEIAVFYRVHAQSRVLEEALRSVQVPYQIIGGTKFYDRAEVKDALAYLRVLVNPQSDVDLLRIINTPPRGIGGTTLDRLQDVATRRGTSLFEALERLDEGPVDDEGGERPARSSPFAPAARKRLGQVRELLRALRDESTKTAEPAELLQSVLAKSGYRAALEREDSAESDARLENLGELEGSMHDYAAEARARGEEPTLEGFLERVSLQSDVDTMGDEGRVTLMTVHGAKGLEFDLVVVTGLEEDMFPYRGMEPGGPEELDEERRLMYVAVTRAKKHLVMTTASRRQIFGKTRLGVPSRFLSDLPREVCEELETPRAREARSFGGTLDRASVAPASTPWRHPQAAAPAPRHVERAPMREIGERYVERDFDDVSSAGDGLEVRRGTAVEHAKFGRGEVRKVLTMGEPAVVAYFPGWGEVKVLARFLRLP